jgi:hypothetical protein
MATSSGDNGGGSSSFFGTIALRGVNHHDNTHLLVLGLLFAAFKAYGIGVHVVASAVRVHIYLLDVPLQHICKADDYTHAVCVYLITPSDTSA